MVSSQDPETTLFAVADGCSVCFDYAASSLVLLVEQEWKVVVEHPYEEEES